MSIITDRSELLKLCHEIDSSGRCALDLEFIPERTFEPVLCLVQVATDHSAHIVDPLALPDLKILWERICDPRILVVLHAANQDLDLVYGLSGLVPSNIFDTQIGAGFGGFGYPVGYGKLLNQLLGVTIAKTESFTDWLGRPLTESQIEYALEDVCHLLPMYDKLCAVLKDQGRLSWAEEECKRYVMAEKYQRDRSGDYLRIKGASGLNRRGLAVLQALTDWRNKEAVRTNKPTKSILADNSLVEVSRRPPQSISDIQRVRGIRPDQIRTFGALMLKAVEKGMQVPESELPSWPSSRIPPKREVLLADYLFAILKVIAYNADIATELVCTRDDLQALVRAHRERSLEKSPLPLLQGWRRDMAGNNLISLLDGEALTVSVDNNADPPIQFKR
ncbi:MAG TPA: ribonuclease D [Drouetiella sp.]|jgi:ribonuclease D